MATRPAHTEAQLSVIGRVRTSNHGWQRVAVDPFGKAKVKRNEAILQEMTSATAQPFCD